MKGKIQIYDIKMTKTIENLNKELETIRAGRANPHILNKIKVNYYGVETSIQQVANITIPEARIIQIQPWESALIKEITQAIQTSDLGIYPNTDGKVIRLIFPELTEERRKELVKDVKKKGEAAKISIRNIRRDANDAFKKLEKENVSEDEINKLGEEVQKLTDKYIKDVEQRIEEKSKKILTV
ncbi:MAG: ribosome recycling factor [Lachnospiraceae bacterium]|nr:ribosome recycling factor [Lachnospiraceae bacterium]